MDVPEVASCAQRARAHTTRTTYERASAAVAHPKLSGELRLVPPELHRGAVERAALHLALVDVAPAPLREVVREQLPLARTVERREALEAHQAK